MRKILLAALSVFFIVSIILISPFFKIKNGKIENSNCVGNNFLQETDIQNRNIFLIQTDKIKSDLKNKYSCLADVEVKKVYPATISINTSTVKSILKIDASDLALTENNLVIKSDGNHVTPVFFPPQGTKFTEGEKVMNSTILFVIALAADVQKSDFVISNIRLVEGGYVALYSRQDFVAIFSQNKDVSTQVDSLQAILAKAKIDSSKIEKIDLRFDKPVLVFKQTS